MPIESSQYLIILFRVNKVFIFYHIIVDVDYIKYALPWEFLTAAATLKLISLSASAVYYMIL